MMLSTLVTDVAATVAATGAGARVEHGPPSKPDGLAFVRLLAPRGNRFVLFSQPTAQQAAVEQAQLAHRAVMDTAEAAHRTALQQTEAAHRTALEIAHAQIKADHDKWVDEAQRTSFLAFQSALGRTRLSAYCRSCKSAVV
ncbi:hypothetical protein AB0I94_23390 [Streptomyces sp. NPDC050147]|uniref:hypothetical protein n=1 Tax=Streptomyces sp. NPDC050147 TaxID=3155513 RepID=UPI00341380E0